MNIAELLAPLPTNMDATSDQNFTTFRAKVAVSKSSKPRLKKHPCLWPGCGKLFGRPSDTTRHYRIHTNDRRYICHVKFCGKRFIQQSALTVHLRTHSGERPHCCEFADCDKKFSDSSSLARHRRIHTGNRPYHCSSCPKSYTKKYLLNRHIERHHQEPDQPSPSADDVDRPKALFHAVAVSPCLYPPQPSPFQPTMPLQHPILQPLHLPAVSASSSFGFQPLPYFYSHPALGSSNS
ncbi:hypothetical protein DM01DRAFT_1309862, partial [Hesseltinella vesiculosa]